MSSSLINDSFGHGCGDATLVAVARCLKQGLREAISSGEWAEMSSSRCCPGRPVETATQIADKLELALRALKIVHEGTSVSVSASFGCAQVESPESDWGHLLIECDKRCTVQRQARRAGNPGTRRSTPFTGSRSKVCQRKRKLSKVIPIRDDRAIAFFKSIQQAEVDRVRLSGVGLPVVPRNW